MTLPVLPSWADGYNDWGGEVAAPGEIYAVPAISAAAAPDWYAYWQLQVQVGLEKRLDLLFTLATTQQSTGWTHDGVYIQPRWAVTDTLNLSLGWFVPGNVAADPLSLLPGVFQTIQTSDEVWLVNWNFVATMPIRAPGDVSYFAPVVCQRKFSDTVAGYVEVDLYGPLNMPGDVAIDVFVGTQVELSDVDTLNVSLMLPAKPDFEPTGLALGVWWARGFEVKPLRRSF